MEPTAIILASGPSLTQEQIDIALASGHKTIVVNATYQKALTASLMYSGDFLFFKTYMADIVKRFRGEVWSQDATTCARWPKVKRVRAANREGLGRDGKIHLNGNSGFQAINLAFFLGYRRIVLLGFDMRLGPKGEKHHHPDHPSPMVQGQTFSEWLHKSNRLSLDLANAGCEVLNATPSSALSCWPMVNLKDVL
jgi:hypothetical protein